MTGSTSRDTAPSSSSSPGGFVSAPESGSALYEDIRAFIRRYVVVRPEQSVVLALWVLHTWVNDAAWSTPYLHITSPARRSGKSRLLEVLRILVHEPLPTGGVSVAALFRAIAATTPTRPTLLFDEVDAIFRSRYDRERNAEIAAVLNNGYRRGNHVLRCVSRDGVQTVERFDVFCPKALAGIRGIPDTVADRCLVIRMERRTRENPIERFRERYAEAEAEGLRSRLEAWAREHVDALRHASPDLPEELDDRGQDVAEPLLAIAEFVGVAELARSALVEVRTTSADAPDDEDPGLLLLAACKRVLDERKCERITTDNLIRALCEDEEAPWVSWRANARITPRDIASLLRPFDIQSTTIRLRAQRPRKGYRAEDFQRAFRRWLPATPDGVTSVTPSPAHEPAGDRSSVTEVTDVTANQNRSAA